MKLFFLVFFICFVQICMSASISNETDDNTVHKIDINEVETLQNEWKAIPGINQQGVKDFAKILKKFNKNFTAAEIVKCVIDLLNIVLNKDVAEDKKVKLQVATIIGSDDDAPEIIILLSGKVLPIENLTELNKELSGKMNESQTTRLFEFFRKINTESGEVGDSVVDLINEAIKVSLGNNYAFNDGNIVYKAVDENQK